MSFARSSLSCHAFAPLFGAGFAAGYLLRFDTTKYLTLLNYLAQEASGLTTWRLDQSHTLKSYVFAGMPASNAVKCALMVHAGWTGAGDVLGNDRNFFDAIAPGRNLALDLKSLGTVWGIEETDFKKYSVGFPIAAPLAALESILDDNPSLSLSLRSNPNAVDTVEIFYHPDWYAVIADNNRMPDLNLRHCLAATMIQGRLSFDASHNIEMMQDEAILAAGKKVQFLPPLSSSQDRFVAVVRVTANDGEVFEAEQGKGVLGRIDNPMTAQQVEEKAAELFETVYPSERVRDIVHISRGLYALESVETLLRVCRG
jgi:2-methylcitrate dehydratase PrpD